MAVSRKMEREILRNEYLQKIIEHFQNDEDVLRVKSNEIAIPVVGCEDNEDWIVITVKVPTGANKGTEPYDGYEMAEEYEMKLKEKELKAKEKEEKKKKKIERDKEIRRKKKEIAEKGKQKIKKVSNMTLSFLFHKKSIVNRRCTLRPDAMNYQNIKTFIQGLTFSFLCGNI